MTLFFFFVVRLQCWTGDWYCRSTPWGPPKSENVNQHLETCSVTSTLPETSIAPQNKKKVSQKESNLPTINFQGLLLLVSGRVYKLSRVENSKVSSVPARNCWTLQTWKWAAAMERCQPSKAQELGSHLGGGMTVLMMCIQFGSFMSRTMKLIKH